MRTVSFSMDDDVYDMLRKQADKEGFNNVSALVKHLSISALNKDDCDKGRVILTIANYSEVAEYAHIKAFGTVSSFLSFSANQYMSKYPLSAAQKQRNVKSDDD